MRKLFAIYVNFIEYVNKLYEVERNAVAVVGMDEKAVLGWFARFCKVLLFGDVINQRRKFKH